jgi:hypothetical protein
MSAALRQALRQLQQEAPQLSRSVRTSAGPRYHYVSASATCKTGCHHIDMRSASTKCITKLLHMYA